MTDGQYVSWDRWDAEHRALTERIILLEKAIEEWEKKEIAVRTERHAKIWQGVLLVLGSLVLPLTIIGILALLHLQGN
jgi:hypothetical protein